MKDNYNSINPHKLYKNPDNGVFSGICTGIADYFDISRSLVRFVCFIVFFFNPILFLITYFILSALLDKRPNNVFSNSHEEKFWKGVAHSPTETFKNLRYKFRSMNERLKKMENKVTSKEFELEEKYKNL